jgi:cytochrome c oxidase subunit II
MIAARLRMYVDMARSSGLPVLALVAAACAGSQSALDPKGPKAEAIYHLSWFLFIIVAAIYVLVISALLFILRRASTRQIAMDHDSPGDEAELDRGMTRWVASAVAVTTVVLIGFIFVDVSTARSITGVGGPAPLRIDVVGHQWWWEVQYEDPNPSKRVGTANEIHVPVGEPVQFKLRAADVIHSFWAPNLNGKRDLIPGYMNTLWFTADTAGIYRGQCAEFCGLQHAKMAFYIVAEPKVKFAAWLAAGSTPPEPPKDSTLLYGQRVFMSSGCAVCHSIGGTEARATVGPDLTHFKGRNTIAAGTLANTRFNLTHWIENPSAYKPGVRMPALPFKPAELNALVSYLETLK